MVTLVDLRGLDLLRVLNQTSLIVKSELQALPTVLSHFNHFYLPRIPREVWLKLKLALAEGFTNAVRHAHRDLSSQTPIEIQLTIFENRLQIKIWDHGPGFDLPNFLNHSPRQKPNQSGGSRGLGIIAKIADQFSYYSTDEGLNCLLIIKDYVPEFR